MGKISLTKLTTYDAVANPGFTNAKLMDSAQLEKLKKEKLRKDRKEKLEKLKWEEKH